MALVNEWPRRAYSNDYYSAHFNDLYIKLETLQPDSQGLYDDEALRQFHVLSLEGIIEDDEDNVSRKEKRWAWDELHPASNGAVLSYSLD